MLVPDSLQCDVFGYCSFVGVASGVRVLFPRHCTGSGRSVMSIVRERREFAVRTPARELTVLLRMGVGGGVFL